MATDVPHFIRFLLSTTPEFDCYFVVGNKLQGEPERIGAVKLMLMSHSEVFRLLLKDSKLAEKRDVKVEDIHPGTFKGMLKYVYGHDITSDLCFDDADNMLYVAEKYMMQTLKNKLAVRLIQLLNPDNICSLLNNPACYKHLELDSAITEILRFETDRVLASPQFVLMNAEGFLKILEQDGLVVPEIELWRATLKWAEHRANSEDGHQLRQQISCFTKHMRLCSMTSNDIFEVITADITREKGGTVCEVTRKKRKLQDINDFSFSIVPRVKLEVTMEHIKRRFGSSRQKQCELVLRDIVIGPDVDSMVYNFTILTKQSSIELLPLVCLFNSDINIDCTTTKAADIHSPDSSSTNEPLETAVHTDVKGHVPLCVEGNEILLPDTKYTFKMKFNGRHRRCISYDTATYTNDHLTLEIFPSKNRRCHFPSATLKYRVNVTS